LRGSFQKNGHAWNQQAASSQSRQPARAAQKLAWPGLTFETWDASTWQQLDLVLIGQGLQAKARSLSNMM
jgi:hypothetical protein